MKNNTLRYFDSAATTPLDPRVGEAMISVFDLWGNPGSKHHLGHKAQKQLDKYLGSIAQTLAVDPGQIIPTHGGTDANRRILWELSRHFGWEHIYCSRIEHASIADEIPASQQFDPITFEGLPESPAVIVAMAANNETGLIIDIKSLRAQFPDAIIVSDWVQALGKMPWDTQTAQMIDFATFAAHKIHGPKGAGLIYMREPARWEALSRDTHTRSLHQIAGMAKAFELLPETSQSQIGDWTNQIQSALQSAFPDIKIHHAEYARVPGIISIALPAVRGGELMMELSQQEGICISTGSACTSDILKPTRVIQAIESDPRYQYPIRIGLHRDLNQEAIDEFIEILIHYIAEK